MEKSNESHKSAVLIFIMMLFFELVLGAALLSKPFIINNINDEISMVASFVGDNVADEYHKKARENFKLLFVRTSIMQHTYKMWVPDSTKDQHGLEGMGQQGFDRFEVFLDNLWDLVFKGVLRGTIFVSWLPFFLPLLIPAIINGLMIREVKKLNYGYASPVRFSYSYKTILGTFIIVPIYFLIPIAIHPAIVPLWLAVISICLLVMFSNLQKMI